MLVKNVKENMREIAEVDILCGQQWHFYTYFFLFYILYFNLSIFGHFWISRGGVRFQIVDRFNVIYGIGGGWRNKWWGPLSLYIYISSTENLVLN